MKTCKKCGIEKELIDFCKNILSKGGYENRCKKCRSLNGMRWEKENKESRKIIYTKYRSNSEKYKQYVKLQNNMKDKEKNIFFSLRYYNNNIDECRRKSYLYSKTDNGIKSRIRADLKKQIGETPPTELVEIKLLIYKTKKLCKTLKN